jgi:hypothetical protein
MKVALRTANIYFRICINWLSSSSSSSRDTQTYCVLQYKLPMRDLHKPSLGYDKIMVLCLVMPCVLVHYHQLSHLPSSQMQTKTSPFLLSAHTPLHNDNIPWMFKYSTTLISG